jgi:peptide/nickel transport system substrate-binding protein
LQNFDNFSDPQITADLEQARATANPDKRAALVAQAEKLTMQKLPWIPDVEPVSLLLLGKGLSGAVASFAAMFSPWADKLGGTG